MNLKMTFRFLLMIFDNSINNKDVLLINFVAHSYMPVIELIWFLNIFLVKITIVWWSRSVRERYIGGSDSRIAQWRRIVYMHFTRFFYSHIFYFLHLKRLLRLPRHNLRSFCLITDSIAIRTVI